MSKSGIYKIEHLKSGKCYIGRAVDFSRRKKEHLTNLALGRHPNKNLQNIYDSEGIKSLRFKIIKRVDEIEDMIRLEMVFIKKYHKAGLSLNILLSSTYGGDALTNNPNREIIIQKRTETNRKKIDALTKEERYERFAKNKMGKANGMYGRTHSEAARKIFSETHKGNKHALGHKRTEEQRKRLSELASARTGEKNPFYGKTHSAETKAKLRALNSGFVPPNQKRVEIDGIVYESGYAAAIKLGVSRGTITHRVNSPNEKFKNYKFLD